ncbi:MAG: hypothetical protein H6812_00935 [Phycisphaeraceae bacterium]|nr:hypothetical protein [Phycisphaerales bacterium]MCB9841800.1 hypothetical protein [Phycisphaeraceae bacterium]
MMKAAPGERYTIRRKILTLVGASFHVYDPEGNVVAFCRQKAFKLREDMRLYTDESMSSELLTMKARSVIDFGATYDVTLPDGQVLGSLRRKGLKSILRDQWLVFAPGDAGTKGATPIATIIEDSGFKAFSRRFVPYVGLFMPQKMHMKSADGREIATFRQHFNLFVYRLGVTIHHEDERFDDLLALAAGCLLAAIEGRQDSA